MTTATVSISLAKAMLEAEPAAKYVAVAAVTAAAIACCCYGSRFYCWRCCWWKKRPLSREQKKRAGRRVRSSRTERQEPALNRSAVDSPLGLFSLLSFSSFSLLLLLPPESPLPLAAALQLVYSSFTFRICSPDSTLRSFRRPCAARGLELKMLVLYFFVFEFFVCASRRIKPKAAAAAEASAISAIYSNLRHWRCRLRRCDSPVRSTGAKAAARDKAPARPTKWTTVLAISTALINWWDVESNERRNNEPMGDQLNAHAKFLTRHGPLSFLPRWGTEAAPPILPLLSDNGELCWGQANVNKKYTKYNEKDKDEE